MQKGSVVGKLKRHFDRQMKINSLNCATHTMNIDCMVHFLDYTEVVIQILRFGKLGSIQFLQTEDKCIHLL